jgi:hypothetical protein
MKTLLSVLRWMLLIWGAISFMGVLVLGGIFAYRIGFGNKDKIGEISRDDARFVLNWSGLGDERIKEVIYSFESSRNITGDHIDVYAIEITHVDISELEEDSQNRVNAWYRCGELEGVLKEAVEFSAGWANDSSRPWFPSLEDLHTDNYYVYSWSIDLHGIRTDACKLIFIHPENLMVYYVSCAV